MDQRLVAVIRTAHRAKAVEAGRALFDAGLRAVEISLTTDGALDALAELAHRLPVRGALGAGTVLDTEAVRTVAAVGATFVVAPNMCAPVIHEAHRHGMAAIPAASTPTEMISAHQHAADLIKLFPASLWTPAALRDVRAALPHLQFVPTGGVTVETAPEWIRAGSAAVGMGSALTTGNADMIARRTASLLANLAEAAEASAVHAPR
jgi:2-dehydro-3-deoxyphosphogluconate aldolase/(4S)-4-hydroxy-2-oxoglutarate aldolase